MLRLPYLSRTGRYGLQISVFVLFFAIPHLNRTEKKVVSVRTDCPYRGVSAVQGLGTGKSGCLAGLKWDAITAPRKPGCVCFKPSLSGACHAPKPRLVFDEFIISQTVGDALGEAFITPEKLTDFL